MSNEKRLRILGRSLCLLPGLVLIGLTASLPARPALSYAALIGTDPDPSVTLGANPIDPSATLTAVYIHGYSMWVKDHRFGSCNNRTSCTDYWNKGQVSGRVRHVGWNGAHPWIWGGVDAMTYVMDQNCRRDQKKQCTLLCHSTGCLIAGYFLDRRNKWTRGSDGRYGYIYNVVKVQTMGSAEGGSDLASDGTVLKTLRLIPAGDAVSDGFQMLQVAFTGPGRDYLKPTFARGYYNHNNTTGVPFFMVSGKNKGFTNWVGGFAKSLLSLDPFFILDPLIGEDDGVVAFHSACGYSKHFYSYNCSNDWEWCCRGFLCRKGVTCKVPQWSMHKRVEYCGRGGCSKNHGELTAKKYHTVQ